MMSAEGYLFQVFVFPMYLWKLCMVAMGIETRYVFIHNKNYICQLASTNTPFLIHIGNNFAGISVSDFIIKKHIPPLSRIELVDVCFHEVLGSVPLHTEISHYVIRYTIWTVCHRSWYTGFHFRLRQMCSLPPNYLCTIVDGTLTYYTDYHLKLYFHAAQMSCLGHESGVRFP